MNIWTSSEKLFSCDRTALIANNGQASVNVVDAETDVACKLFSRNRNFHNLEEFGLTRDDFISSVLQVEQLIASYKALKA